jgi:hypothetical protein
MKRRIPFALILTALTMAGCFLMAACFQTVDEGVSNGVPGPQNSSVSTGPTLPAAFADADLSQQCEPGSALCYQLCGSPECALQDDAGNIVLPPTLQTPAVVLPTGAMSPDPCADVSARALQIRQQACAQCHDTSPGIFWNYVLDDHALVTTIAPGLKTPLVIAGDPAGSVLYQRVLSGLNGDATGMPPSQTIASSNVSPAIAQTIVYPTPEDVSLLYGWILNCAPGTDGGAYAASYYGGNYGPGGDAGAAPAPISAPVVDAGSTAVVDAGSTAVVDASTRPVDAGSIRDAGGGG